MQANIYSQSFKESKNKLIVCKILKNMTKSQAFHFVYFTMTEFSISSVKRIKYNYFYW